MSKVPSIDILEWKQFIIDDMSKKNKFINNNKTDQNKVINKNPNYNFDRKPYVIQENNTNQLPLFYHHRKVLKLPMKKRVEAITRFLEHQLTQIKIVNITEPTPWCKPISQIPGSNCNDGLNTELSESTDCQAKDNETVYNDCNDTESSESAMTLRSSKRILKRKNYKEANSDDECDSKKIKFDSKETKDPIIIKKTNFQEFAKTQTTNKKTKLSTIDSDDDFSPILSKKPKFNNIDSPISIKNCNKKQVRNKKSATNNEEKCVNSEVTTKVDDIFNKFNNENGINNLQQSVITEDCSFLSDFTDDIFPQSKNKKSINKSANNTIADKNSDSSDFSEDVVPESKTIVDIHNETTPKNLKERYIPTLVSTRCCKTEKQQVLLLSANKLNNNDKETELDVSNNNKSSSKMTQCPICSHSYPSTEIEFHASRCEQYDESQVDPLCIICNKRVLHREMEDHRIKCLEEIKNNSTFAENSSGKNKKNSKLEFLCSICDKYIPNTSKETHNNSCIAILAER